MYFRGPGMRRAMGPCVRKGENTGFDAGMLQLVVEVNRSGQVAGGSVGLGSTDGGASGAGVSVGRSSWAGVAVGVSTGGSGVSGGVSVAVGSGAGSVLVGDGSGLGVVVGVAVGTGVEVGCSAVPKMRVKGVETNAPALPQASIA